MTREETIIDFILSRLDDATMSGKGHEYEVDGKWIEVYMRRHEKVISGQSYEQEAEVDVWFDVEILSVDGKDCVELNKELQGRLK